jgi:thymidylate kinase
MNSSELIDKAHAIKSANLDCGGIVLEGADQSGKTTFANKLSSALEMPVYHVDNPEEGADQYDYYTRFLNLGRPVISDRSFVSELVYGPVLRGKSKISPDVQSKIETSFNNANYILVVLNRKNYEWEDRREMYTKDDNDLVMTKYIEVFDDIDMNKIMIDAFDDSSFAEVLKKWIEVNG